MISVDPLGCGEILAPDVRAGSRNPSAPELVTFAQWSHGNRLYSRGNCVAKGIKGQVKIWGHLCNQFTTISLISQSFHIQITGRSYELCFPNRTEIQNSHPSLPPLLLSSHFFFFFARGFLLFILYTSVRSLSQLQIQSQTISLTTLKPLNNLSS